MSHYHDQELKHAQELDAIYKSARLARREKWLSNCKCIEEAQKPSKLVQAHIGLSNAVKGLGVALRDSYKASSLALIIKSIMRSF